MSEILGELDRIRKEKVSDDELKNAKALYNGRFALGMENPATTANYASNILLNNLPADFYRTYLQKINAVTVADIQRVSNKYFNRADARVVAVGKAAQIKDGLVKLGYPVKQYDKTAQPVTESAMVGSVTAAPKPQDIINNYIKAIGGADELAKVTSINSTGEMVVQGMTMQTTEKKMAPNMEMTEVKMNGMTAMRQTFDGTTGSKAQMGNKKDLDADELAEKKGVKSIFPQLGYANGYTLEAGGTDKVDGSDAYKNKSN